VRSGAHWGTMRPSPRCGVGLQVALATPEGQATAADVPNYASGGVALVHYDVGD